jgi:hypothetical protein
MASANVPRRGVRGSSALNQVFIAVTNGNDLIRRVK